MDSPNKIEDFHTLVRSSLVNSKYQILEELSKLMGYHSTERLLEDLFVDRNKIDIEKNPHLIYQVSFVQKLNSLIDTATNEQKLLITDGTSIISEIERLFTIWKVSYLKSPHDKLKFYERGLNILTNNSFLSSGEIYQSEILFHKTRIEQLKEEIASENIIPVPFFEFKRSEFTLKNLEERLTNKGFIEYNSGFRDHFRILSQPHKITREFKKIRWLKNLNSLTDMFFCMMQYDMIPLHYRESLYADIVKHFCQSDYSPIIRTNLFSYYNKAGFSINSTIDPLIHPYPEKVEEIRRIMRTVINWGYKVTPKRH